MLRTIIAKLGKLFNNVPGDRKSGGEDGGGEERPCRGKFGQASLPAYRGLTFTKLQIALSPSPELGVASVIVRRHETGLCCYGTGEFKIHPP